jgi:hypothetical protein
MTTTTYATQAVMEDAFLLDPLTEDLSAVTIACSDGTNNGCGPSPTTGPTTGCAAPDGPAVPARGCYLA